MGVGSSVTKETPSVGAVMQAASPNVIGEKNKQKSWVRTTNLWGGGHVYRWRAVHFIVTNRKVVQHRGERHESGELRHKGVGTQAALGLLLAWPLHPLWPVFMSNVARLMPFYQNEILCEVGGEGKTLPISTWGTPHQCRALR